MLFSKRNNHTYWAPAHTFVRHFSLQLGGHAEERTGGPDRKYKAYVPAAYRILKLVDCYLRFHQETPICINFV